MPQRTPNQAYEEMRAKFLEKGGRPEDIRKLNAQALRSLPSGVLAEWIQLGNDEVHFTTSGAKHPVIAGGRVVRGAGSMKVYKDQRGQILAAVVSNSSGNYKPGAGSTEGPVQELVDLDVPEGHILVTSVIPEEPELVKLLLKAKRTFTDDQIRDIVGTLRKETEAPRPVSAVKPGHLGRRSRLTPGPLLRRALSPPLKSAARTSPNKPPRTPR